MPEGKQNGSPRKLKVDEKNRFHIKLSNGKEKIVKLTDSEIYTLENWFHLIGKHKLRLEIMNILQIYSEINITQLSQKVEQSKSTVARHLQSLEKHSIVVSRKAKVGEYNEGQIPPKIYSRNMKLLQIQQYFATQVPEPGNPKGLKDYYRRQIKSYRNTIDYFKSLLDKTTLLFDEFEGQIEDLPKAKETWEKYIDEETTPADLAIDGRSFNRKYYEKILEAYKEFMDKFTKILAAQNTDPDAKSRDFTAIFAFLPVKDLFDLYKKEVLDKKKK